MCRKLLERKISVSIFVIFIAVGMSSPLLAVDHWWHGGFSSNINDPANWTDRDASTSPTTPTGDPRDIVRIGGSWGSEDLNGNGRLDAGEDLNGNGIIDDPVPDNIIGWGGYYGSYVQGGNLVDGGGVDLPADPVLSETYVSRNGTAEGGWWFVLNSPNILTLTDGAFLIMDEENCNIRNGGRIEIQGRSETGGPSLITAGHFRIAENGSIPEAAQETCQFRIKGTGWVQVDATLDGGQDDWFRIGAPDLTPDQAPRGEVIIEERGRLEVLSTVPAVEEPYILFGHADPNVNQIIIRDDAELLLPGDPETMGRLGAGLTEISLQDILDMGLIANDQGFSLNVSGINPTVISVAKPWASRPNPADGETNVASQVTLSWSPSQFADIYDVYFGTDVNSITEATRDNSMDVLIVQDLAGTLFDIDGFLDFNQTYHWRVDAINDSMADSPWASPVWSFTTGNFDVVDDFEDYNDYPPNEIWNTWIDGYGDPTNGSSAGYPNPDFVAGEHYVEVTIVRGGAQSMPLFYENTGGANNSEVSRTFSTAKDWTRAGINTLTLYVYGKADNTAAQFYAKVNGVEKAADVDFTNESWQEVNIELTQFGVDLQHVTSLAISIQGAGSGVVFIDDIRVAASLE